MMEDENSHPKTLAVTTKKDGVTEDEVVYGHSFCQTRKAKWLCLENIYEKFYRPNYYDIGGTYIENVADYWFMFKTEQVGQIFLLHLFFCNHSEGSCNVAVSSSNEFHIDKKRNIAFLTKTLKDYKFENVKDLSQIYIKTFNFSELDIDFFKNKKLYIAIAYPTSQCNGISMDVLDSIKASHDFGALLNDPIGSDFVIESADNVKFQVHKVILSAHSEVFKAMLKEETAESLNSYVKLVDVNSEDLRCMLEYIYTGTVKDVEIINYATVLSLADRYNLRGLVELTQYALSQQINSDNVLDVLYIADTYDLDTLKRTALKFVKQNVSILNSSTFKEINNADLLRQLSIYLSS